MVGHPAGDNQGCSVRQCRKKIFALLPCSRVQSGMFTVVDLPKGFRFQSPSPLSVWLVGWTGWMASHDPRLV